MSDSQMHVPELLAPAGSVEAFNAALAGGADAIYCALGDDFNARRMAAGFTEESFAECCRAAHLLGARVYATVNIVIATGELEAALRHAARVLELGADALIVQDWGLMALLAERLPGAEVHVSTQSNVHDARGVRWCAETFGAKRVTLSRELSLPEIAACAATGIDCEVFAHGAICFGYSGVCLMSALRGGRSGNRGQCANPCRLPYDLVDASTGELLAPRTDLRPLCPRDNCTIDDLAQLAGAGVDSLKLEGRIKGPDYVFAVTRAYRGELDAIAGDGPQGAEASAERRRALRRVFNRGFTDAYLHGRSGNEMLSFDRPNNRGDAVGEALACTALPDAVRRRKLSNGRDRLKAVKRFEVEVALSGAIGAGDMLEFRCSEALGDFTTAPVAADAAAGERIAVITGKEVPVGAEARVVRSQAALDDAARIVTREGLLSARRRPVDVAVTARLGEHFAVELATCDGAFRARAVGPAVEAARTRAVTRDDLAEHVCRMGSTFFEPRSVRIELDEGCGMGFSMVHHVRAEACELLEQAILEAHKTPALVGGEPIAGMLAEKGGSMPSKVSADEGVTADDSVPSACSTAGEARCEVCVLASTPGHARRALAEDADRVYAPSDALAEGEWPAGVIPVLDEICREPDRARLDSWVESGAPVAVGNVSELALACERGASAELRSCIPVHNPAALEALVSMGARGVWLSPELSVDEIEVLAACSPVPTGLLVAGHVRAMTSEHCVLQVSGRCCGDCRECGLRGCDLALREFGGALHPVRTDAQGRSRVYHAQPLDLAPEIGRLVRAGVSRFLVDATLMDEGECARAVERVHAALEAARTGGKPLKRLPGATDGLLQMGIR